MSSLDLSIRPASPRDAASLAPLVDLGGGGLPMRFWAGLAGAGETAWDVARARIEGQEARISHRNGWVASLRGQLAGCLFAYDLPETRRKVPPDCGFLRPLYELEAEAAGTGYIHVLATVPSMKGRGVASRLLEFAESRHRGPHGMSMVLSEVNAAARGLCERHCYRVTARREMETDGWSGAGGALLLLVKPG